MDGGIFGSHFADAAITANVAAATANGIQFGADQAAPESGEKTGLNCDWIMSSAAPVMKPTTTGYGMKRISRPPPDTAITIWITPASAVTAMSAVNRLAPASPAPARVSSTPESSASAGPVGELTRPMVPPKAPEARLRHAAPSRPANAPFAALMPISENSATP